MNIYYTFKGSVNGDGVSKEDQPIGADGVISNIIITNTSNSIITVNIFIKNEIGSVRICPFNLKLGIGECYSDRNLAILRREAVVVNISGGTADYYFSIIINGNNT